MEIKAKDIKIVPVAELRVNKANRNKHPPEQIDRLAKIIEYQGFRSPVIVSNLSGLVVAGHGRLLAAKKLGIAQVPVIYQDFENSDQEYAASIADNSVASWSELDLSGINLDLGDLGPDFDIDLLGIKGFTIDVADKTPGCDEDDVPAPPVDPIAKRGDIWQLGRHRLMCGDSTMIDDVEKLMDGDNADGCFTSPPYNCVIKYNQYDDKKEKEDYLEFVTIIISNLFAVMKKGRIIFWNCGSSPKSHAHAHALESCGFTLRRQIIWKKTGCQIPLWQNTKKNPVARYYLPNYTHENIFMASTGEIENGEPTTFDEKLANDVWEISQFSAGGKGHPAAFPVELVELPLVATTNENELIFEPFGGSGTTLIACEKTNRKCFMMEIDPHYVDVIVKRFEKYSGQTAVLIT